MTPGARRFYHTASGRRRDYFFFGPLLTVSLTFVFRGRFAPARLLCAITRRFLTFALKASVTLPAAQRRFLRPAFAWAIVFPLTVGALQRGVTGAGGRPGGGCG